MSSTFMSMGPSHCLHGGSTSTTTMSTYGLSYFNDVCSSGECSDGYQSSISPVNSPSLGHYNYSQAAQSYGYSSPFSPKKTYNYQNDGPFYPQSSANFSSTFRNESHEVDYSQSCLKVNVQIKSFSHSVSDLKPAAPVRLSKVNRFVQQFNQQHETLNKKLMEHREPSVPSPPPEILKKRRVAANARERRRMNSLNFAFDR
jgi:hypothetical protein